MHVLLTNDGEPKISDFGLVKRLEDEAGHMQSGSILGTPSYMAPEQAEGRLRDVGPCADVCALGAVLYELLSGRPPFRAATVLDTICQVRHQEPVPPSQFQPNVPRELETICLRCLQKDTGKRYPSAPLLAEDLRRFVGGEPILAHPVGRAERLWRWSRRNPGMAALSACVSVVLVAWAATSTLLFNLARSNECTALDNAAKASRSELVALANARSARQSEERAQANAGLAKRRADAATATARDAIGQLVRLGDHVLRPSPIPSAPTPNGCGCART
jgi:eukaryotic-like serine/threonine-protein kinase